MRNLRNVLVLVAVLAHWPCHCYGLWCDNGRIPNPYPRVRLRLHSPGWNFRIRYRVHLPHP